MKQLDLLEVQKNIEENRLIFGKKFQNFLLKKTQLINSFFKRIFAAESCAFFGCLIIIAISVLARSSRDIGYDSAISLEVAAIPHFSIIALEIFSNLIGILALYVSFRILRKSDVSKDQTVFNLIILSFACGFFLRVFTLQFNEFGTKTTYFLALAFPYISYQLARELKNSDQVLIGFLAAAIFCLNLHYGILVLVFELAKLFEKKSFKPIFCLRNLVTFLLLIFYSLLFPGHIAALSPLCSNLFLMIREDLFPILLLISLCFFLLKKNHFLQPFFLTALASLLIVISQLSASYDQRTVAYSLSLPFIILAVFLIIKNNKISWRRDRFILFLIFFVSQFDEKNFFALALDLCAFWWVFVLIISAKLRKKRIFDKGFLAQVFLPRDFNSWFYFSILALGSIALSFNQNASQIFWIISAIIFALLINFYQKISADKNFSRLTASTVFMVLSYIFALHLAAIFNFSNSAAFEYKTPNYVSEQMAAVIKKYSNEGEQVTAISSRSSDLYPLVSYLGRVTTPLAISAKKPLFSKLKQQLENPENKLVFVEKKSSTFDERCEIGFLEYYFRDEEFKNIFLKNYVFLNRIIEEKTSEEKVQFFNDGHELKWSGTPETIERDVEIYIRK